MGIGTKLHLFPYVPKKIYPLADYRKIPALIDKLCRETYAGMKQSGTAETIRLASDFVYRFAHIKPFGEGNLETAVLLMNYIQLYRNEPLLMLFADDYPQLLNALKTGKISEKPEDFEEFILHEQIRFLNQQL